VVVLCLSVAGFFGYTFWKDLNSTARRTDKEKIAIITFKNRIAQRKFDDRVVWERIDKSTPLYNGDLIRTAELAEAVITFNDGSEVDIYENTISQISLPEVAELKLQGASFNEAMEIIVPDILSKSGVSNFLKGVSKEDINKHFEELGEKDYSEMPLQCYRAMFILSTAKAIPIQTSYDTYKNNHDAFNAVDIKKLYQQVMTKMV
jgi:hypothetical protein